MKTTTKEQSTADPTSAAQAQLIGTSDVLDLTGEGTDERSRFYAKYGRTTALFLYWLDQPIDQTRKQWPALIFADFLHMPNETDKTMHYSGVFQKFTPATITRLLEDCTLATEDELDQLRGWQQQIDEIDKEMSEWTLLKASEKFHMQSTVIAGGQTGPARTREEIQGDHRVQLTALEMKIKPLSKQSADLASAIISRTKNPIICKMLEIEASERIQCEEHDLAWVPSPVYRAAAAVLIRFSDFTRARLEMLRSPRNMLAGFVRL
ncbi:MAG TPA: hypothetical protein VMJ12_02845 [Candidatus Acidoferrales bacterium]|nr:hypothetical protein [Candidatus Acidoferrales bacterium]